MTATSASVAYVVSISCLLTSLAGCPSKSERRGEADDGERSGRKGRLHAPPRAEVMQPEDDLSAIFKAQARSESVEKRLKPALDKALGSGTYVVECHGDICKLAPVSPDPEWERALQFNAAVRDATVDMLYWKDGVFVRVASAH